MDALELLKLQIEWGADEALDDAPINRLQEPKPPVAAAALPAGTPAPVLRRGPPLPAAPRVSPAERSLAAASQANTLDELRTAVAAFDGCALRDTAAHLVFAEGDPATGLLLIGDAPGETEDRTGTPFSGPEGALLMRMLASIGLQRSDLMLTPLVPWRPPGGRPPTQAEITVCLPFLHRLITLTAPQRIVLASPLAVRALLGTVRRRPVPVWLDVVIPGHSTPLPGLILPSPGALPRMPAARKEAWAALRLLRRTIEEGLTKI